MFTLSAQSEPVAGFEPRPYQRLACRSIAKGFLKSGYKSQLGILPTGTGKTVVFGLIAKWAIRDLGRKTLILAHRGHLLEQAADELAGFGLEPVIEKAGSHARALMFNDPECVVASIQTMMGKRLKSWDPSYFGLIITDEAHHAASDSYRKIYKQFPDAWHLGVTATPERHDKKDLGLIFERIAYQYTFLEAVSGGYLSKILLNKCAIDVDLRMVRTTGRDLNIEELKEAIKPYIGPLANGLRQEIGKRTCINFMPDVGSAQAMSSALDKMGVTAEAVWFDDPLCEEKLRRFKAREFQVLVNVGIATEGFNVPHVEAIGLMNPTNSGPLIRQMIGRGTRLSPKTGKQDCIIVDFGWLTDGFSPASWTELFASPDMADEVLGIAKGMVEKGETNDLLDAIKRAEKVHCERETIRLEVEKRAVKYRRVSYDPCAISGDVYSLAANLGMKLEREANLSTQPTDAQLDLLRRFKIDNPESMSRRRASQLIDNLFDRKRKGLATQKQVAALISNGMDATEARKATFEEASAFLDIAIGSMRD